MSYVKGILMNVLFVFQTLTPFFTSLLKHGGNGREVQKFSWNCISIYNGNFSACFYNNSMFVREGDDDDYDKNMMHILN